VNRKLWSKSCREEHRILVSEIVKKKVRMHHNCCSMCVIQKPLTTRPPTPPTQFSCHQSNVMLCAVETSQKNKLNSVIAHKFDAFSLFAMLRSTRFRFCVRTFASYFILDRTLLGNTTPSAEHRDNNLFCVCSRYY
jgi:hypothetical protein